MPKVSGLRDTDPAPDRGGRPATISREKVLEAARQLRSHELTMNAVAELLGVKKASLYYYFASRQDLLVALSLNLARDWVTPGPDPANWRRWLVQAVTSLFEMLCANPVFHELENINQFASAGLPLQEAAMETLEEAGFTRLDGLNIWRVTTSHAYVAAAGIQQSRDVDVDRLKREMTQLFAEAERSHPMPRMRARIKQGLDMDPRQRFFEVLAWQVTNLPDPPPKQVARRAVRKKT